MNRRLIPFRDILEERRKECSNFMWVSREINTQLANKQYVRPKPSDHKIQVLNSIKIKELIDKLSIELNVTKESLQEQIKLILDEIGFSKHLTLIRWLGIILIKICLKVCNGIHVNEESILKVKSQMGNTPVIFLPSHRSYADFILMSFVCFTYDIEIPAIASGMDFHAMWGMGSMLRETGAFFMHRTYNDDTLYWNVFKQYVHQLVTKGDTAIEFFIEGTRSRSGKSLVPKLGFLSMILKAFFNSEVSDILFVPISISYDRVMEEKLFAYELLGVPKPKESTSAFFKSLSMIKEKYGNIYFNFAQPISARQFFDNKLDRSVHSIKPTYMQEMTEIEKEQIPNLASQIVYTQQKHSIITAFNLISVILTDNLMKNKTSILINEMIEEVNWLKTTMEIFEAVIDINNTHEDICNALNVHKNLIKIDVNDNINIIQNDIVLDKKNILKLKGHDLSEKTMKKAVPFVMLQLYVNPIFHYVIDAAIVIKVLLHQSSNSITKDELFKDYKFLRSIFTHEFVHNDVRGNLDFEDCLIHLAKINVIKNYSNDFTLGGYKKLEILFCNLLTPFLHSYYTICCILYELNVIQCEEKIILITAQAQLEIIIEQSRNFIHPYCLCLDTLTNCLNSLIDFKALTKKRWNGTVVYKIDKELVNNLLIKIGLYLPSCYKEEISTIKSQIKLKNKL